MKTGVAAVGVAFVAAILLSGCGSDSPTVTPVAADWAEGYCTSVASLKTPLDQTASAFATGKIATPAQAQSTFAPLGAAAKTFSSSMAKLDPGDSESAAAVTSQTDDLATTIDNYVAQANASLDAWAKGTGSQAQTLSTVGSELRGAEQELAQTTADIRTADSTIAAAIDDSATCQALIDTLSGDSTDTK